jgi:hypothetical protein
MAPMSPASSSADDHRLVRFLVAILLASWLAGTAFVLQANAVAPTTPPLPLSAGYLAQLKAAWGWYASGYVLFFVADCSIALLGAALVAWLPAARGFRGPAIVLLFALSGVLGVLADVEMVGAAQYFRLGSPALQPGDAAAWLDSLNTRCNWLSAASFLPAGIGAWMTCTAARAVGVGRGWIALTRFGALYQIATGVVSAAAFLTARNDLTDASLLAAIVGLPVFVTVWLIWMLREMTIERRQGA